MARTAVTARVRLSKVTAADDRNWGRCCTCTQASVITRAPLGAIHEAHRIGSGAGCGKAAGLPFTGR